jgi:transmembrane 9 superfamily member 2/4
MLPPQEQDFVRPGFELGFKEGDKYFIKNHLQFNVLVHPTHGEYMRARESLRDAAVLDSIDARRRAASRRVLLEHSSSSSGGRALASDAADAKAAQAASQQEAAAAGKGADGSDVK